MDWPAAVVREGVLSGTGEECGTGDDVVRAGQRVDGAAEAAARIIERLLAKTAEPVFGSKRHTHRQGNPRFAIRDYCAGIYLDRTWVNQTLPWTPLAVTRQVEFQCDVNLSAARLAEALRNQGLIEQQAKTMAGVVFQVHLNGLDQRSVIARSGCFMPCRTTGPACDRPAGQAVMGLERQIPLQSPHPAECLRDSDILQRVMLKGPIEKAYISSSSQRQTSTGIVLCSKTFCVSLPSISRFKPCQPWVAITMRSQWYSLTASRMA